MILGVAVLCAALALAFGNGANDNFKGVATLHGSGRLPYRKAATLATLTTLAGSLSATVVGTGLAGRFSGRGLVPDDVASGTDFVLSVAIGAALTVLLATRAGFPVSTTHALTGALVGGGLVTAGPAHVSYAVLGGSFVAPLLVGPLAGLLLAGLVHAGLSRMSGVLGTAEPSCLCHADRVTATAPAGLDSRAFQAVGHPLHIGPVEACQRHGARPVLTLHPRGMLDGLHMASAAAVGFARGLNDTPKIAGVLVAAEVLSPGLRIPALALAIAAGGLLAARRVARTLSFEITPMDEHEGLTANLVTAALVLAASPFGLPVSTTHVSCGALFGIGASNGRARWRTVGSIATAWGVTLPAATLLSMLAALALMRMR